MNQATSKRILFVLTSHGQLGDTGRPTGFYLSEVSHPYAALRRAGWLIDFVSPKGGKAPVDGLDLDDPANREFWENPITRHAIEHTAAPSQIRTTDYAAIYFAGGHGTVWDLPGENTLAGLAAGIYERGGIVGAVCHGVAGLINVKLPTGEWLVAGKELAAFTNDEERAVELDRVVPFSLADKLVERGARHRVGPNFTANVVVSDRLVTGQNPQSALEVGEAMARLLAIGSGESVPPVVPKPANANPVVVTLRLHARDSAAFKRHLLRVIPTTRKASGCRYSHSAENPDVPGEFLLVQAWDSLEQQKAYLSWRQQRGDLAEFLGFLERDPAIETSSVFDY
jgi:putative intracellular protease/amidase/quinol monooxygenase YgiN